MHKPVLCQEVVNYLQASKGGKFIDATVGSAGHTVAILKANDKNLILGMDWDRRSLVYGEERLTQEGLLTRGKLIVSNYREIDQRAEENNFLQADGILVDLGFSSTQLDEAGRGLSFQNDGALDMRYSEEDPLTARDVVNKYSAARLMEVFEKFGEEKFSRQIVAGIMLFRKKQEIKTTVELADIIQSSLPSFAKRFARDSKSRVFQAIRIEVNSELENLKQFLPKALKILKVGGRLVVISFHSLEDRIVKQFFVEKAKECICPKEVPVCVCHHKPELKIITRKPLVASSEEVIDNPRSKAAKMRVAEKM
jgi:16S rRNA (cytosine1402-N4)-methyltransferase